MAIKRTLRARTRHELEAVWPWLDDASFSPAAIRWNESAREVTIPIAAPCDDQDFPARRPDGRGPLTESYLQPWFRMTLTIHATRSIEPVPQQLEDPGIVEGLDWHPDAGLVRVRSINEAASFDVRADELNVELVVTDEIDQWRRHTYGRLIPWESHGAAIQVEPDA